MRAGLVWRAGGAVVRCDPRRGRGLTAPAYSRATPKVLGFSGRTAASAQMSSR